MVAHNFESFVLPFRQRDPEPGVDINDLPAVHANEVMVRGRLRIKTHFKRVHGKFFDKSSLL
jgi:hypothetical protein